MTCGSRCDSMIPCTPVNVANARRSSRIQSATRSTASSTVQGVIGTPSTSTRLVAGLTSDTNADLLQQPVVDPGVQRAKAVLEPDRRLPPELGPDAPVVAVPTANSLRGVAHVGATQMHARDVLDDAHELIYRDELRGADVERMGIVRRGEEQRPVYAVVDVHETS